MKEVGFEGTALVGSGPVPSDAMAAYDVRVHGGRLRLTVHESTGTVLDVPLERVHVRPLGRAGSAIVAVDGAPLLVDLSRRRPAAPLSRPSSPASATPMVASAVRAARRVAPALRGRWLRRRFMSAVRGGGR